MDRVNFARLASVLSTIAGRSLSEEELRELDIFISHCGLGRCDPDVVNTLMQRMRRGDSKIEAIKAYRSLTGLGLVESKNAVERHWPALSEHAS